MKADTAFMSHFYSYQASTKKSSEKRPEAAMLLTIPDVAQQLHISRAHVYTLIKQGLPTIHLGRCVRVNVISLRAWLLIQETHN
ncbi:helix-turn-helix domain-containing protein [Dictyobacter kobayashii]|uniref:Helix-turn-helix domain-containing protein n=1 Tax=Dictyobacter kobayashii TaxID=2014872 RepID=A0A402AVY1_9CHLR|nr:helix-turn-helix domain-containing protein [Dictyobacter kobayashii]GCE23258.1 hypothetical protein KDK_70580 [Dictyobacter kobayashii]